VPTELPPLLRQLIDDAAVFPPGNAPLLEAVDAHRDHRRSWYRDLVGPLLIRGSDVIRREPQTGFAHHGFLNVLAASIAATRGADEAELGAILDRSDGPELARILAPGLAAERTLWTGFGSCSMAEPLSDLVALGLIGGDR
jgi:hypothetical protein